MLIEWTKNVIDNTLVHHLKNIDLEHRREKILNDLNCFNNSVNNIKKLSTYFKDKNNKAKTRFEKYKTLTTILKSVDTIVISDTTTSSDTMSVTGIESVAIPISTATACGLSIGNKVKYEMIIYTMNGKDNMKKINKLLNLLISYTGNHYKIS